MGTIYSQLLLVGVKDIDSGRAQRLREDITEQVKQLQDVVSSMDEVYRARAYWDRSIQLALQEGVVWISRKHSGNC